MRNDRIDQTKEGLRLPKNFWWYFLAFAVISRAFTKISRFFFDRYKGTIVEFLGIQMSDQYVDLTFIIIQGMILIVFACAFYKFYMKKTNMPKAQ